MKKRIIEEKAIAFGIRIMNMTKFLKSRNVPDSTLIQIRKSGTSIGANVSEGSYAQSTSDYISKHSIALKEANETQTWLKFLYGSHYITEKEFISMMNDLIEIIKILTKLIKTSKGIK